MSNKQLAELGEEVSGVSQVNAPLGYEMVSVGDFCEVLGGKRLPKGYELTEVDSGFPYLRVTNFSDFSVDLEKMKFVPAQAAGDISKYVISDRDVYISIAGTIGSVGMVPKCLSGANLTENAARIVVGPALEPKFLMYQLASENLQNQVKSKTIATTQAKLGLFRIKELEVVLPPLPEQKRIADKLDATLARVDACRERLARVTPLLKRFRQSVLAAATSGQLTADWREQQNIDAAACKAVCASPAATEQVSSLCPTGLTTITADLSSGIGGGDVDADEENPISATLHERWALQAQPNLLAGGWEKTTLGELLHGKPRNGYSPKSVDYETNVKSLTLSATTSGVFKGEFFKYIDEAIPEASHLWLEKGDILIQRANSLEYVGVSAVFDSISKTYIYPDLMMKCRPNDKTTVWFLHILLRAETTRQYFRDNATGTAGNMPKINQQTVMSVPVYLPPAAEQTEIVHRVETLFAFADRLEARLASANAAANRLTPSLLAKAFRGELVPQDPSDEPASELLKRLAAQREATASKPKAKKPAV